MHLPNSVPSFQSKCIFAILECITILLLAISCTACKSCLVSYGLSGTNHTEFGLAFSRHVVSFFLATDLYVYAIH